MSSSQYLNPDPFVLFFSILGIVAVAGIVADLLLPRLGINMVRKFIAPIKLELITAVALTSMGGSLFFSEALNFVPCFLCWVQRGFMYPAAVILTIESLVVGLLGRSTGALLSPKIAHIHLGAWIATPLASVGLLVALFHRYEQSVESSLGYCDAAVPCSQKWFNEFGFITIPTLAAAGFATIAYFGFQILRSDLQAGNKTDSTNS